MTFNKYLIVVLYIPATIYLQHYYTTASSGVPCYLQPASDDCHYSIKPDAPQCTNAKTKAALEKDVKQLNRSILSLEEELIRLGVIPPDNACSELPAIENGAIVYSDLNLQPGSIGKYVCNEGYYIKTLYGSSEFTCNEDGVWNHNSTAVLVSCVLEIKGCKHPSDIVNGSISTEADMDNLLPGDMIVYACNDGFKLNGTESIFCTRNGNWSKPEPRCLELTHADTPSEELLNGATSEGLISASSIAFLLLLASVIVIIVLLIKFKLWKSSGRKGTRQDLTRRLVVGNEDRSGAHSSTSEYPM